jgi:CubicO group peptidase (beta-lactamase class C family)
MGKEKPQSVTQEMAAVDAAVGLAGFADFVRAAMADWKVPGLAVAAVKDGRVVVSEGFGVREVNGTAPVTPHTLFAIGSCTKAFTATGLAILVDEGKLDWDTPVRNYLPAFQMHDPVASERMTARDLLTHRSGLPRHDFVWYGASRSRKELFDRLRYLEPSKDFRSVWQYQNLMYMAAGYLAGEIAGQSWEDFTRARLLEPLGMAGSNFSVQVSQQQPDYALPHKEQDDTVVAIPFRSLDSVGPAGSINASITDMVQWLLLNLNRGRHGDRQIVSESRLAQVQAPQMVMPSATVGKYPELPGLAAYGLGWMVHPYRGHLLIQHSGGIDGFTANVALVPDANLGIVVLNNLASPLPTIIRFNLCDRLLGLDEIPWHERIKQEAEQGKEAVKKSKEQSAAARVAGTQPSHPPESYTGDFTHPAYGTISIRREGERLRGRRDEVSFSLDHYHYDVFAFVFEHDNDVIQKIAFSTNLKGDIDRCAIGIEPMVADIVFTRAPASEMREKGFLERFTGVYDLAGTSITVTLKGESVLQLSVPGQPDYELAPYKDNEFTLQGLNGFSVAFTLDETGAVTGAVVTQPNGVFTATRKGV